MNLELSSLLDTEKLYSNLAFLLLVEVPANDICLVKNSANVNWGGKAWFAFPMELGDHNVTQERELPELSLKVSNVLRALQPYIEDEDGFCGKTIILRIINSKDIGTSNPEMLREEYTILSVSSDVMWLDFKLGCADAIYRRLPTYRYTMTFCRWRYGSKPCGVTGSWLKTPCGKTIDECNKRGNIVRFGGFPGIPQGSVYGDG